jgi:hypothetical protein
LPRLPAGKRRHCPTNRRSRYCRSNITGDESRITSSTEWSRSPRRFAAALAVRDRPQFGYKGPPSVKQVARELACVTCSGGVRRAGNRVPSANNRPHYWRTLGRPVRRFPRRHLQCGK